MKRKVAIVLIVVFLFSFTTVFADTEQLLGIWYSFGDNDIETFTFGYDPVLCGIRMYFSLYETNMGGIGFYRYLVFGDALDNNTFYLVTSGEDYSNSSVQILKLNGDTITIRQAGQEQEIVFSKFKEEGNKTIPNSSIASTEEKTTDLKFPYGDILSIDEGDSINIGEEKVLIDSIVYAGADVIFNDKYHFRDNKDGFFILDNGT